MLSEPQGVQSKLSEIIRRAKEVARDYYALTGKPLGITGEIGEYEAARLFDMELAEARMAGFDAIKPDGTKVQIKTRYLSEEDENKRRVPAIKMDYDWDTAMLVLLNEDFEVRSIYEVTRDAFSKGISSSTDKTTLKGAPNIRIFKQFSQKVWSL